MKEVDIYGLVIMTLLLGGFLIGSNYYSYITLGQAIVVAIGMIKGIYEMNKYGKIR